MPQRFPSRSAARLDPDEQDLVERWELIALTSQHRRGRVLLRAPLFLKLLRRLRYLEHLKVKGPPDA